MEQGENFERLVMAVLMRFQAQNGTQAPEASVRRVAANLLQLVTTRGLPPPLAENESGAPGGMTEAELAPLVARVVDAADEPLLGDAARQLVKACVYPEFTACRDSFREVGRDGSCRRQELPRARGRVSGIHCVDCPHWVALASEAHQAYVTAEWRGNPATFRENRSVFLPEDFRALREWLHRAARAGIR